MPPNNESSGNAGGVTASSVKKDLKTLPENEIAIDGVVYTLDGFNHPGGDMIKAFGGNDVSVHYRMIHPFHAPGTLKKMTAVGVTSKQTDYSFGSEFEKELTAAVAKIVKPNQRFATPGFWFRLCFYIGFYSLCLFSYVVYGSSLSLCIALGGRRIIKKIEDAGLNCQHDANHGAISPYPIINEILGFGADLIGGSKYLWIQQHWTHHAFTNDVNRDPDASSCDPFFLFHNYPTGSPMRTAIHALQHFYMLPVLSFYWLSSVFNSTAFTLTHEGSKQAGCRFENSYIKSKRPIAIGLRFFYLACTALSPFFHHDWKTALFHVWFLSVAESLSLSIPFALSHNFVGSERYPFGGPDKHDTVDWYKSQVETSCTYGGFISGCLCGGLNFQIEHHLFPRMCSAWYPYIQPTVMEVCKKHGVRYTYYPTFFNNWMSTVSYIASVGRGSIPVPKKSD